MELGWNLDGTWMELEGTIHIVQSVSQLSVDCRSVHLRTVYKMMGPNKINYLISGHVGLMEI